MCAKALWIMGPRGGTKAAPSVVMHVGAAIPCLMARVQIPPQPLVDCVLFACFVFVLVFFSTCAHTCLPHRVAMWIKQGNVSSAAWRLTHIRCSVATVTQVGSQKQCLLLSKVLTMSVGGVQCMYRKNPDLQCFDLGISLNGGVEVRHFLTLNFGFFHVLALCSTIDTVSWC